MIIGIEFEVPNDFKPDTNGCEENCILSSVAKDADGDLHYRCPHSGGNCPLVEDTDTFS